MTFEIRRAALMRLGYSGGDTFAEVEVHIADAATPLIATFRKEADGGLALVNVTEKRGERELDWYDNNLHEANPAARNAHFHGGGPELQQFGQQVLAFEGVREAIEDRIYYGS